MFVIFLKFSDNKGAAGQFMEGHSAWVKRGFDDGVFLVVGSLQQGLGGGIVAHNISLAELEHRINEDPFVAEKIVTTEIVEISVAKTDQRLDFLLN